MIRQATVEDLPRMESAARAFFASSRFLRRFDMDRFIRAWAALLSSGTGVIFALFDRDEVCGAIGGVVYPDINTGELIASEFFWFIRPGSRGDGLRLYRAFERWARTQACRQIRMVHLTDSMPDRLARVYRRLGYLPAETHYVKELES